MGKYLGPATWAFLIILGGVLMLTPEGIDPIVTRAAGAFSIVLGVLTWIYSRGFQSFLRDITAEQKALRAALKELTKELEALAAEMKNLQLEMKNQHLEIIGLLTK